LIETQDVDELMIIQVQQAPLKSFRTAAKKALSGTQRWSLTVTERMGTEDDNETQDEAGLAGRLMI
jgi:hypothetical protein